MFVAVAELSTSHLRDVRVVEESLRELVRALEPDAVFLHEASELWAALDAVERLATSAKTLLARRVESACAWRRAGYRSAAEQLAALGGTSLAAARAMLETSKQLDRLPATAEAVRAGRLSAPKSEAIASAAAIAPGAEQELLASAGKPLAEVRELCLRVRAVDSGAAHERIRRQRRAREYSDSEGAWNFSARGTPEAGAGFRAVYEPIVDEMFKAARAEGRSDIA